LRPTMDELELEIMRRLILALRDEGMSNDISMLACLVELIIDRHERKMEAARGTLPPSV
jgi:hypothetical protein